MKFFLSSKNFLLFFWKLSHLSVETEFSIRHKFHVYNRRVKYHKNLSNSSSGHKSSFVWFIFISCYDYSHNGHRRGKTKRKAKIFVRSILKFLFLSHSKYFDEQWFWISYATIHILACLAFTGKIYYMGRLKVSYRVHVCFEKALWKYSMPFFSLFIQIHLYRLVRENGICSRPRYLNRMLILIVANCLNIAFALYGAFVQPESFPNHLLFVFLGNLAIYLMYYILMKVVHREEFTRYSIIYLLLAVLFWSSSLYFFYQEVKSYEVPAAISRMRNRPCILLNTYDVHDIWHLLSSFSLFFSFLTLLTLDDGIRKKRRKQIAAFWRLSVLERQTKIFTLFIFNRMRERSTSMTSSFLLFLSTNSLSFSVFCISANEKRSNIEQRQRRLFPSHFRFLDAQHRPSSRFDCFRQSIDRCHIDTFKSWRSRSAFIQSSF